MNKLLMAFAAVVVVGLSALVGVATTYVAIEVYERVVEDVRCVVNEVCDEH